MIPNYPNTVRTKGGKKRDRRNTVNFILLFVRSKPMTLFFIIPIGMSDDEGTARGDDLPTSTVHCSHWQQSNSGR